MTASKKIWSFNELFLLFKTNDDVKSLWYARIILIWFYLKFYFSVSWYLRLIRLIFSEATGLSVTDPQMANCWGTFRAYLFSLSNNKNYRLKKIEFFSFKNNRKNVRHSKKLLNRQYIKIKRSQKHYWENFKITDHKYWFRGLKIIVS